MKIRAFITHKLDEQFRDCQDRFCINPQNLSVAVSDGMSQSIFQKIWAGILSSHYVSFPNWVPSCDDDNSTIKNTLAPVWLEKVHELINEMKNSGKNTRRSENSIALGKSAGATLVGIRFIGDKGEWEGDVLGDSCLIELEGSKIIRIETSQNVTSFDNTPDYFDSNPLSEGKGKPKKIQGILSDNKSILLVSDPISDLLNELNKQDRATPVIEQLLAINTHEEFESLVSSLRTDYFMHNDDTTLVVISYDGESHFNNGNIDDIDSLSNVVQVSNVLEQTSEPEQLSNDNKTEVGKNEVINQGPTVKTPKLEARQFEEATKPSIKVPTCPKTEEKVFFKAPDIKGAILEEEKSKAPWKEKTCSSNLPIDNGINNGPSNSKIFHICKWFIDGCNCIKYRLCTKKIIKNN